MKVFLGIMAYNEEANVGNLLEALSGWASCEIPIEQIVVVSSGSTDGTDAIVRSWTEKDPRIVLLTQKKREGKASAINHFLEYIDTLSSSKDLIIMESADTLPNEGCLKNLLACFEDPQVGMAGSRPVPVNDPKTFMGFLAHLIWNLHHELSLRNPKMGELIAFRNIFRRIPYDSAVDEASIEPLIVGQGYRLCYASEAIVSNCGPKTIRDFIKQRRRIYAGHLYIRKKQGYSTSTMNPFRVMGCLLKLMKWDLRSILWTKGAVFLEMWGRFLGMYDFHFKKKNPYIWEIAGSSKNLTAS